MSEYWMKVLKFCLDKSEPYYEETLTGQLLAA